MKKKFTPWHDKILVEPIKDDSFLNPDQSKEEMAKVVAIGKSVKDIRVGDTVFFRGYGLWTTPEVDGKKYYVVTVSPEFILGILK
jgi:co-chaperonin GroES (HSP10)